MSGDDLKKFSDEDLEQELARRRASKPGRLGDMERRAVDNGRRLSEQELRAWVEQVEGEKEPAKQRCPGCGRWVGVKRYRVVREVLTRAGRLSFKRNQYYCGQCRRVFYPRDAELGLPVEGELSEGIESLALDFALTTSYEQARERCRLHHGFELSVNAYEAVVARRGAALVSGAAEPAPFAADTPVAVMIDGSMQPGRDGFREARLACLLALDGSERKSYVGSTRSLADFERRLRAALRGRRVVLWLADGAEWIWGLKERLAPKAVGLLDWYHLAEHVHACAEAVLGDYAPYARMFEARLEGLLWEDRLDDALAELEACKLACGRGKGAVARREALRQLMTYLVNHGHFLGYPAALARGWPLGSGAVEAGHKHVWHARLKLTGARWSAQGLERMAQLRILYCNVGPGRFYRELRQRAA